MLLIIHISIALSSIAFAGYTYIKPSQKKFYGSYASAAATLITGTALIILTGSPILKTCLTGIAYVSIVLGTTFAAQNKLRKSEES